MYISLPKLSEENSSVGELAAFPLGRITEPSNDDVREVVRAFNAGFDVFKTDKEVVRMLSLADRYRYDGLAEGLEIADRYRQEGLAEGRVEGLAEGRVEGIDFGVSRMMELIKTGLSPEDAFRKIQEEKSRFAEE